MWGMSKDFGLAGFRMGFIHSYSKDMMKCLDGMQLYTSVPVHIQQVLYSTSPEQFAFFKTVFQAPFWLLKMPK